MPSRASSSVLIRVSLGGVRLSPHFYNKDEEIDDAITAVEEILKERAVALR